jgi:hypothetical protein
MDDTPIKNVYLCPQCLTAAEQPGRCEVCGGTRLGCRLGEPDDACRRPLIDAEGRVRTRAPLWWLVHSVGPLIEHKINH